MSHLATADDDPAFAAVQAAVFASLAHEFPPCVRHLANSAAALTLPDTHFDAMRCVASPLTRLTTWRKVVESSSCLIPSTKWRKLWDVRLFARISTS